MKLSVAQRLGWPIIIVLSAFPLILWLVFQTLPERFGDATKIMTSLGQALGLVGLAMFSINLVLGARLQSIESFFGGMNKVYIIHHITGGLAFVFLLLHPVALILKYLLQGATFLAYNLYLWPASCTVNGLVTWSYDCATNYGVLALSVMILTLFLTFFAKLPYQVWKFTHKFLGLSFFLGALHVLMIPSDVSADQWLRGYVWFLVAIGAASILYRTLLGFLIVPRLTYRVKEVRKQSPAIMEIVMEPVGKPLKYKPGQFMFINFPSHHGLGEVHPFSISSSPADPTLAIGFKALGDYTKALLDIHPGDLARVEGPFGRTSYVHIPNTHQIWVAGGIGVTPFLGMARALDPNDPVQVDMYYSLVDRNETAFVSELQTLSNAKPNFHFIPHYAKESGYLTAQVIKDRSGAIAEKDIILCGPPPMMKGLKKQFADMHLNPKTIHSEEFSMN